MTVRGRLSTTSAIPAPKEINKNLFPTSTESGTRRSRPIRIKRGRRKLSKPLFGLLACVGITFLSVNVFFFSTLETSNGQKVFQLPGGLKSSNLRRGGAWIDLQSQPFNQENKAKKTHHLM